MEIPRESWTYMIPHKGCQETLVQTSQASTFPLKVPLPFRIRYKELLHRGLEHSADRSRRRDSYWGCTSNRSPKFSSLVWGACGGHWEFVCFEVLDEEGGLDVHELKDSEVAEVGDFGAAVEELFHVLLDLGSFRVGLG